MTKVLIIGDTHGDFKIIEEIISDVKPNVIVHTGDYDNVNLKNDDPFFKIDRELIKNTLSY